MLSIMQMPDEVGKYIQDFLRPTQPKLFETYDEFTDMYDYFIDLRYKYLPKSKFKYNIGMIFTYKNKEYIIENVSKSFIYSGIKKYKKDSKIFNLSNLENKSERLKGYFKVCRMLNLMDNYLCLPRYADKEVRDFYKKRVNRNYKKFWTGIV